MKILLNFQEEFIGTLDNSMVRKLEIRGLRRRVGSMDYIHTLLIMEDDLDDNDEEPTTSTTSTFQITEFNQVATTRTDTASPTSDSGTRLVSLWPVQTHATGHGNDRQDNSTLAFRKAAYRQFIFCQAWLFGQRQQTCPSFVVLRIRARFPSVTGIYMAYREH